MKLHRVAGWPTMALVGCGLALSAGATGCQAVIGGQTLPSPHYLEDDVQYFPAGPEFLLSNQVRALDEYRLQQAAAADLGAPLPAVGPIPAMPPATVPGGPLPPNAVPGAPAPPPGIPLLPGR